MLTTAPEKKAAKTALIGFGPRVRKSPYFEATRRWGCKAYSVYNHTYIPLWYDSPEADYWSLVKNVSLWDVGCQRQVEIAGPDADRLTQLLVPRDLSRFSVGRCKYVLMTDDAGGIVNDPLLLKLAEDRFWFSLADHDVLLWVKGVARGTGLDVTITEPDVWPLQVQGPKSPTVMASLFGDWVEELGYFSFREATWNGASVVVSRTGWSGERGFEIFLRDSAHGDALWEAIMAAGKHIDIAPGAPSAIRRIEGSLLSYGADMTLAENPFELGLDRLVDLDMAEDFIGKAALMRIRTEGVRRRLVGLEIGGKPLSAPNEHPWPVFADGARMGTLTSAVHSLALGRNIGMAMVTTEATAAGTALIVERPDGATDATVVPLPFVRPLAAGGPAQRDAR